MRSFITLTILSLVAAAMATAALAAKPAAKPAAKAPKPVPKPMVFSPAVLELAPGETYLTELWIPNVAGKEAPVGLKLTPGAGLSLIPDRRWTGKLPRYGAKLYPKPEISRFSKRFTLPNCRPGGKTPPSPDE